MLMKVSFAMKTVIKLFSDCLVHPLKSSMRSPYKQAMEVLVVDFF